MRFIVPVRSDFDLPLSETQPVTDTQHLNNRGKKNHSSHFMVFDCADTDKEVHLFCEIPGVPKDKIDVTLENKVIIISVQKDEADGLKEDNYRHRERHFGKDTRKFKLSSNINEDSVTSTYIDGVLHINIKKADASTTVKKIEIM